MAGKRVQVFIEESGKQLESFKTRTLTKLFKKIPGHTVDIKIQEPGEQKIFVGKYPIQGDINPPPDPTDKAPVVDAGTDAVVGQGVMVNIDGSARDDGRIVRSEWQYDPECEPHLTKDPDDPYMLMFHTPNLAEGETARGYLFRLEVEDDKGQISADTCIITVTQDGQSPPPPPTSDVLYDSNTDGGWKNGQKRVVKTSEGNVAANGKGVYTAASGNPILAIDGDGVAHLIAGSGGVDNLSLKLLSRHQEGGACENRGGGEGVGIGRNGWDIKREKCHNIHTSLGDGPLTDPIEDYKWCSAKFSCQHNGSEIKLIFEMKKEGGDWVKQGEVVDKNPDAWFMDKALNAKNSYFWIRLNNSDHGRIYILAVNWDSVLTLDFMFEPKENSIALRNVLLKKM